MKKIRYILMMALGVCAMMAGCQELDSPTNNIPTIQTGDATEITATSATITAILSNGTASGRVIFQISTSEDMSDAYESENMLLRNLAPGTTYYYIAMMRSFDGKNEVRGEMKSFMTINNLRIGKITFTDWDGTTKEFSQSNSSSPVGITFVGKNEIYHNQKTTYDGTSWKFPMSYEAGSISYVCAYWPYSEENYINEEWGKVSIDNYYSYSTTPELAAEVSKPENNGSIVNINLKPMKARVIFHFSIAEDHQLNSMKIGRLNVSKGDNILPIAGIIDLNSATLYDFKYNKDFQYDSTIELSKGTTTDYTLYSMPTTTSGNVELRLYVFLGFDYDRNLSEELNINWEQGKTYEYEVTIEDSQISITDVTVENWNNNEGGDITVND